MAKIDGSVSNEELVQRLRFTATVADAENDQIHLGNRVRLDLAGPASM